MLSLYVRDVIVTYGQEKVLDDISFTMKQGEILAIIGPNGSGKTTLLRSILGLKSIQSGSILFGNMTTKQIIKQNKIAYLPQYHNINSLLPLTVFEVVSQGFKARKRWFEFLSQQEKEKIEEVLCEVHLESKKNELFSNLSGGQRQRALLALSLSTNPTLLFLDEPTNALDFGSIERIYKILAKLRQKNVGILIISHDLSTIIPIADKIGVLMHDMKYFGKPNELPGEVMHQVFGSHIKFIEKEPSCSICSL